ncbi:hypothetical protein F5B20DRAFT_528254 [Whalleya microplaca]|nr:hypothetical protein F5B20DRAFT_528254 [Whalleya microplaca]
MEHQRLPRRSASHGTLRSSYSSHGRPGHGHGPHPTRPLHKPLRSVNENSVLLPSPGALESMLKTTTETGDIGIFSIKPVPPSPQRGTLSEIAQLHPPPRRSVDDLYRQDPRMKPSSNRDTTSEIISMYGTESHKSTTSTLSPTSTEDIGQRSYSMTTCGSRNLSHHKSTATLQSQASGGPLQRPRSPFPYPTRLKRPGIRPASPALTENGRVDYSRMVEIDRISYRTIHGAFKPSYTPIPRRRPLRLRADSNQSMGTMPSPGPPPNCVPPGLPSARTHSAASMASWSAPYRERFDNTSSRASSLTSIMNLYQRMPPPTLRHVPSSLSAAVPRYYDYSEAFENRQSHNTTPILPLAPVPTRSSSSQRPLILQESDDRLEAVFGEGDSAFFEPESQNADETDTSQFPQGARAQVERRSAILDCPPSRYCASSFRSRDRAMSFDSCESGMKSTRGSDIDLLPSQAGRDSMDTFNPSLDIESKDVPAYNYTNYRMSATPKTKANSPERQVQVQGGGAPTIRSEQGIILRDDTSEESLHGDEGDGRSHDRPAGDQNEDIVCGVARRRSCSEPARDSPKTTADNVPNRDQRVVSMNPVISLHGESSARSDEAKMVGPDSSDGEAFVPHLRGCVEDGVISPSPSCQAIGTTQEQLFRRHKRNQAVLRISTTGLPREDNEGFPHITPSCSTTPLISPKPISPARQLKLKNSIPQLMKALPPLPSDYYYESPPTPSTPDGEDDFAEVLAPFNFSQFPTPQLLNDPSVRKPDVSLRDDQVPSLQRNAPKLKLKLKLSNGSGATTSSETRPWNSDNDLSWSSKTPDTDLWSKEGGTGPRIRSRNKLKLRSSRSTAMSTPTITTVRHKADAQASNVVAEIARKRPQDLFNFSTDTPSALRRIHRNFSHATYNGQSPVGRELDTVTPDRVSSLLPRNASSIRVCPQSIGRSGTKILDFETYRDGEQTHGLKKHLSNLRCLLARSSNPLRAISTSTTTANEPNIRGKIGKRPESRSRLASAKYAQRHFAVSDRLSTQDYATRIAFRRRVRGKILKWAKGAKSAMRVYARKNHNTYGRSRG